MVHCAPVEFHRLENLCQRKKAKKLQHHIGNRSLEYAWREDTRQNYQVRPTGNFSKSPTLRKKKRPDQTLVLKNKTEVGSLRRHHAAQITCPPEKIQKNSIYRTSTDTGNRPECKLMMASGIQDNVESETEVDANGRKLDSTTVRWFFDLFTLYRVARPLHFCHSDEETTWRLKWLWLHRANSPPPLFFNNALSRPQRRTSLLPAGTVAKLSYHIRASQERDNMSD